jgi:rRNA-processing protein FCF1
MKTIILDTNFLVDCLAWKVDFFREIERICTFTYELKVVDKTLDELDKIIATAKDDSKIGAKLAKQVIAKRLVGVILTDGKGYTDTLILKLADKDTTVVATQDQGFKRRLKAKNIPTIIIRQKKYLQLLGI